ncbi:hypothetical protein MAR_022864, partial [Mya arenaria]
GRYPERLKDGKLVCLNGTLKSVNVGSNIAEHSTNGCILIELINLKLCVRRNIRSGLGLHSTRVVFNGWIDYMYIQLFQHIIWPHRDNIIKDMPSEYKNEFPTSLIIIDGTEVNTKSMCSRFVKSNVQ